MSVPLRRPSLIHGATSVAAALLAMAFFAAPTVSARGLLADYAQPICENVPRADGAVHLDTAATIGRLKQLNIDTYFYLVSQKVAWRDLVDEFLPAAAAAGLDVYVYTVPPSESTPERLPWGYDYVRFAEEIARLSLRFPNLRGMAIDDFAYNVTYELVEGAAAEGHAKPFTPHYVAAVREAGRKVNPAFRFHILLYWMQATDGRLLDAFADAIDGVIFAFNDEPTRNTLRLTALQAQLTELETRLATLKKELFLMVYCWELASVPVTPPPTYVERALRMGLEDMRAGKLAGVITYSLDLGGPGLPYQSLRKVKNYAHSGNGRGVIIAASKASIPAGAMGELVCVAQSGRSTGPRRLAFRHLATYREKSPTPACRLEVWWNDQRLWTVNSASVDDSPANVWRRVSLELPAALPHERAELRFCVFFERAAASSFLTVSFDDLETEGFSVEDAGFESSASWRTMENHAAIQSLVDRFDPDARTKMFAIVSRLYAESRAASAAVAKGAMP